MEIQNFVRQTGRNPSIDEQTVLADKRNRLQKQIDSFEEEANQYIDDDADDTASIYSESADDATGTNTTGENALDDGRFDGVDEDDDFPAVIDVPFTGRDTATLPPERQPLTLPSSLRK